MAACQKVKQKNRPCVSVPAVLLIILTADKADARIMLYIQVSTVVYSYNFCNNKLL